jgi:hypothetical protein
MISRNRTDLPAPGRRRITQWGWGRAVAPLLLAGLAACNLDDVLSVEAPSRVLPSDLENPANARVIVNGVVADFECAFGAYVTVGGTIGEELHDSSIASQWWALDRRSFGPTGSIYSTAGCTGTSGGVYVPLSTARWQADNALRLLEGWTDEQVPGRSALLARAAAYGGYSYLLLGESMCSAAIDGGPEVSREQLFELAEQRFASAIAAAQAASNDTLLTLAYAGRARARLNLGQLAEAASDARQVPPGFVFNATFTANDPQRENQVYVANVRSLLVTVDDMYRTLSFAGVPDPRVQVTDGGRNGGDQETRMYFQTKYAGTGAPIPLARYEEAQLIIAEAEGGQVAVDIINELHDRAGLPRFASTDAAEIQQQIIYERRAELFLESQHLGDLIRYDLPLQPAAGTPYQRQKGGTYGGQLCLPLPDVERYNNPNIPDA